MYYFKNKRKKDERKEEVYSSAKSLMEQRNENKVPVGSRARAFGNSSLVSRIVAVLLSL